MVALLALTLAARAGEALPERLARQDLAEAAYVEAMREAWAAEDRAAGELRAVGLLWSGGRYDLAVRHFEVGGGPALGHAWSLYGAGRYDEAAALLAGDGTAPARYLAG